MRQVLLFLFCLLFALPVRAQQDTYPDSLASRILSLIPAEFVHDDHGAVSQARHHHWVGRREAPKRYGMHARWNGFDFVPEGDGGFRIHDYREGISLAWENMGKNVSGRIRSFAFDPTDSRIVWAGASSGGLWRSTDQGGSWYPMTEGLPMLGVSTIALHPKHGQSLLIGIGSEFQVQHVGPSFGGIGVLRSVDAGRTWKATSLATAVIKEPMHSYDLKWDADDTTRTYLASSSGVWRSLNGGSRWDRMLEGDARSLVLSPENPGTVYATLHRSGVWRSLDAGDHWEPWGVGLPDSSRYSTDCWTCVKLGVSQDAHGNEVLFVSVGQTDGDRLYRLDQDATGGPQWEDVVGSDELKALSGRGGEGIWTMSVSPSNPNVLFVGGQHLFRSLDGGKSWQEVGLLDRVEPLYGWFPDPRLTHAMLDSLTDNANLGLVAIGSWVHVDHQGIGFAPDNHRTVFAWTDGGVYRSADSGTRWSSRNDGLMTLQLYGLSAARLDTVLVAAGAQDQGQLLLDPDYYTPENTPNPKPHPYWRRWVGGDGLLPTFDATTGMMKVDDEEGPATFINLGVRLYANSQWGNKWALSLPATFVPIPSDTTHRGRIQQGILGNARGSWQTNFWVTPLVSHPHLPQVLYSATLDSVYTTDWRGDVPAVQVFDKDYPIRWKPLGKIDSVAILAVDRIKPDNLYAYSAATKNPGLYRSRDRGRHWERIHLNITLPRSGAYVSDIEADPDSSGILYASRQTFDHQVWRSEDAGSTWIDITGDLPDTPVNTLAIASVADTRGGRKQIYLGTDAGLFMAYVGTEEVKWTRVIGGLPQVVISDVQVHAQDATLRVATYGRGYWKADLPR